MAVYERITFLHTLQEVRGIGKTRNQLQVKVMTELIGALPKDKKNQIIDQFMALPPHKKESVFYPYYTVEYMQGRVQTATKKAIVQQIVAPHWDTLLPSQQEGIRSLLEECER